MAIALSLSLAASPRMTLGRFVRGVSLKANSDRADAFLHLRSFPPFDALIYARLSLRAISGGSRHFVSLLLEIAFHFRPLCAIRRATEAHNRVILHSSETENRSIGAFYLLSERIEIDIRHLCAASSDVLRQSVARICRNGRASDSRRIEWKHFHLLHATESRNNGHNRQQCNPFSRVTIPKCARQTEMRAIYYIPFPVHCLRNF